MSPGSIPRSPAGRRSTALALALLLPAVLAAGCGRSKGPGAASGGAAPGGGPSGAPATGAGSASVRFAGLDDLRAELKTRRAAGRPVFLNFWATWCEPCIEELPEIEDLAREWSDAGPEAIGVSLDTWVFPDEPEAEAKVREVLARTGVTYTNLIYRGEQDPLLDGFYMPGPIPFSVLYDREGKRVAEYVGTVAIEDVRRDAGALRTPAGAGSPAGRTGP